MRFEDNECFLTTENRYFNCYLHLGIVFKLSLMEELACKIKKLKKFMAASEITVSNSIAGLPQKFNI